MEKNQDSTEHRQIKDLLQRVVLIYSFMAEEVRKARQDFGHDEEFDIHEIIKIHGRTTRLLSKLTDKYMKMELKRLSIHSLTKS